MEKERRSSFDRLRKTFKMIDFIKKIVSFIVEEGTLFDVKEEITDALTTYIILVPETEMGKLIGKGGKVINAIRVLSRLKASGEQKRILVKIEQII